MRPVILVLGPDRGAVSGVSTHVNLLLESALAEDFEMLHFQVGSEGRGEGAIGRLLRLLLSPIALFLTIVFRHVAVVHVNTSLNTRAYWRDLVYVAIARLLRARVLYQVHGGALPEDFFRGRKAMTGFLRWSLGLPDLVAVLARVEYDAYRRFVPEQNLVMMPNGIDCRPFAQVPTVRSRAEYPLRLVYIGRVAREKGLYETLQGIRLATELGVDARIIIAGQGPEEARLRRYGQALGIGARVAFVGPVFGPDKVRLLGTADLMVLPSYAEGLPYALLEAMAAGVPVLATPVGAIPDVVSEGIHGYLVPPRDGKAIAESLALMAGDREKLSWMSRACRRRVRAAFSIERLARELQIYYHELAGDAVMAGAGHGTLPAPRNDSRAAAPRTERIGGED